MSWLAGAVAAYVVGFVGYVVGRRRERKAWMLTLEASGMPEKQRAMWLQLARSALRHVRKTHG